MHRQEADIDARKTCIYVPVASFDRNAHKVPVAVRLADFMWNGGSMSGLYPGSNIGPPTSVYTIPLVLVDAVGGWDVGPEAIGEDLHMYLKCFFATRGRLIVKPVFAPASHCNISSDRGGIRGYFDCMQGRWNQAVRHMWGSLDSGYAIRQGLKLLKEPDGCLAAPSAVEIAAASRSPALPTQSRVVGGSDRDVTGNLTSEADSAQHSIEHELLQGIETKNAGAWRFALLYLRLFEAHFLVLQLSAAILCATVYASLAPSFLTSALLQWTFWLVSRLRTISYCTVVLWSFLYERWHELAVSLRESEILEVDARRQQASMSVQNDMSFMPHQVAMARARLSKSQTSDSLHERTSFSHYERGKYRLQWLVFPVVGVLYGTLPSLVAQFRHLFTDRLGYVVSVKPSQQNRIDSG